MDLSPEEREEIALHLAYEDAKVVLAIVTLKEKVELSEPGCELKFNCMEGSRPDSDPEHQHRISDDGGIVKTFNRNISSKDVQRCSEINFSQSHYLSQLELYEILRYIVACPVSQIQLTVSDNDLFV